MHYLVFFIFSILCTLLIEYRDYSKRKIYSNIVSARVKKIERVPQSNLKLYGIKGTSEMFVASFIIHDETGDNICVKTKTCALKYPFNVGDDVQLRTRVDDITDIIAPEYGLISKIEKAFIYVMDVTFLVLSIFYFIF